MSPPATSPCVVVTGIRFKERPQFYEADIATQSLHGISTAPYQNDSSLWDTEKEFAMPEHITVSQHIAGQPALGSVWLMVSVLDLGRRRKTLSHVSPVTSIQPERLERRLAQVTIKNRVNVLQDVRIDLQELALVGNGDKGTFGPIVHRDLQ